MKGKNKAPTPGPSKGIKCGHALSSEEPEPKKRWGCTAGVVNYSNKDVDALLDIIKENLPTGGKGWNVVGSEFVVWPKKMAGQLRLQSLWKPSINRYVIIICSIC